MIRNHVFTRVDHDYGRPVNEATSPAGNLWRQRWRWLFVPVALAALAWTVALLWDALPALRTNLPKLQPEWLVFVLVGNVAAGYLGFEAFRELFTQICPGLYRRQYLAHLYFTGQMMKHLPGRIWGVAYQAASGNRATLTEWVTVTTIYMVLTAWFALWVAAVVLAGMTGWQWGALVVVAGAFIYAYAWNARLLSGLLALLRRLPLRALKSLCDALQPFADVNARFKRRVCCWFIASWLAYLLAWAGYGMAWPDLTVSGGVWLCALYTIAWFVGYASLITPSGLGVRELVFVLLAHRFAPDAVAGMAVLGRVVLLVVDVVLGVAFLPFRAKLPGSRKIS